MSTAINEGASTSACLSEYELLRQQNMNKLQHEVGDIFSNALQCAQNLKKSLRFLSGRRAAHIPGLRIKLFSKLEKSSKEKEAQRKNIRRSSRSKRKQICYDSKNENNDGNSKKRQQKFKQQKKSLLRKSKVIKVAKQKFSRKVSRLDVSLVTKEMLDNINYRSVGKKYNTENGTTCHQCRQKTMDQKSYCRHKSCKGMRGMFCGFCLRTRYGEDVAEALLNPEWACPPCRGHCNCSICRRDQGKDPTGQLAQVAKAKGYKSVRDLLRTIEGEPNKPQNYNPEENHVELQNKDVVVSTGTQSKIDHLNDETVLDEHKVESTDELKTMKNNVTLKIL
ncbi:PREDICTED: cell division cycle-associated protein 7-like [Diuraphis noxia]|uniref:cell division cycle-associated protein 7-like n=1 Tax=Diuraphis noxia TaxID=143948 RepID=UPI000763660D|nr:PREDICTED: cell division cycle-associated protein 7-like [Diuraphis noxia]